MASGITTAFWGMTINNYDETDLALVQNGYPDYCREIVHTLEQGEEGTPHIQAWIKLQRQQRLSFVKKLFPRGHFKPLTSDQYIANTKKYAQKLDGTAVSAAVHKFNDPLHTIESVVRRVIHRMLDYQEELGDPIADRFDHVQRMIEREMVEEDFAYAKVFVSATYKQMWKQFGGEMFSCVFNERYTHTHTHGDKKLSREGGITDEDGEDTEESDGEDSEDSAEGSESEDYEDDCSETDEGHSEGECSGDGQADYA